MLLLVVSDNAIQSVAVFVAEHGYCGVQYRDVTHENKKVSDGILEASTLLDIGFTTW